MANDCNSGRSGPDTIQGTSGADKLNGGSGADSLNGLAGSDKLTGGSGADTLAGGDGADKMDGGSGNDSLNGGAGADKLNGDSGNDTLDGGSGSDTVNGGSGDDTLIYNATALSGGARDVYDGGSGTDTLRLLLSSSQWDAAASQLTRFNAYLSSGSRGGSDDFTFTFGTDQVTVSNVEKLVVVVDGAEVGAVTSGNDGPVILGAVAGTATEDGASCTLDALGKAWDAEGTALKVIAPASLPPGVVYNAATHSFTLNPADAAYQHLAAGKTTTVTVNYTVSDGTNIKPASATWTITGTNDAPVVNGSVTGTAVEDGAPVTLDALRDSSDVDDGATLSVTNLPAALPPGVTFDAATHSFTLDPSHPAYQHLAAGETTTVTVHFDVSDGTASAPETVSWVITGTNDGPTAAADADAASEDAVITGSVAANDSDPDDGETATLSYQLDAPVAGLTLGADGGYSFDASHDAYQHLAAGKTQEVVAHYTATDAHGATAHADLTITVTGTNDGPTAAADADAANEDAVITGSVATNDSDPDDGETATLSYQLDAPVAGLSLGADGSYSFDTGHDAYQHLAAGKTQEVVAHYTVTDAHGATAQADLTITVTGTNDGPTAAADSNAASEDAVITGSVAANDSDPDDGETATLSYQLDAPVAGLSLGADGGYSFDAGHDAYQHLYAGKTQEVVAHYTVTDAHGATAHADLTITVTGTNDGPTAAADSNAASEDAVITGSVAANDSDPDDGETATLSYQLDAPVAGLSLGADGSYSFDASHDAYQHLAAGKTEQVVAHYTVTDAQGATAHADLTITVTGTNDGPTTAPVTLAAIAEDSGARTITKAELLANAHDVDGDALTVTDLTISSGHGDLAANGDGSWTYTPAANDDGQVSFSYTVSDGAATADGSASLDITPVNDAPTATAGTASGAEDSQISGSVGGADIDSPTLTYSVVSGPAHGTLTSFDGATGAYVYTPNADYNGADSFTFKATDGVLDSDAATVDLTVSPVNDAPANVVPSAQTVAEDTSLSIGGLSVSDVDASGASLKTTLSVDHGTLTVASAGGAAVAGSGTATVTLTGTAAQINATLQAADNVVYRGGSNYNGGDTLTVTTDDQGATGAGGPLSDTDHVSITVTPVNDPATISGTVTGSVTEAFGTNTGTPTAGGALQITDVDDPATFQMATNAASANGYGAFSITSGGAWTYTLDNANETVNNLNTGQSLTDTFKVFSQDGAAQEITITIAGRTDPAQTPDNKANTLVGGSGNDSIDGLKGDDSLSGGAGNDTLIGGSQNGGGADTLSGGPGNDSLSGGDGDDRLDGGPGNDTLVGGEGNDTLSGGGAGEPNLFVYGAPGDAPDTITDFQDSMDKIDFSSIDADTTTKRDNEAFGYGGETANTVANSLTWSVVNGNTVIQLDVDHNTTADMTITLSGVHSLTQGNFIL